MDEQIIKDFEAKLKMFENSIEKISGDLTAKLNDLAVQTKDINEKTQFLKTMKKIYDEQNKKLKLHLQLLQWNSYYLL